MTPASVFRAIACPDRSRFTIARWVFLRLLGAAYLCAFLSLWTQLGGLIGSQGMLPAAEFLQVAAERLGVVRFWLLPTLCWLSSSDASLYALCAMGSLAAILLIIDVAPAACLGVLWVTYLSLVTVGQTFFLFQWDSLLLEIGFVSIFFAPWRWRPRWSGDAPAPLATRVLLWWLLFRLMFSSGVVKLASGDAAWRGLSALTHYYETQPLPTWIAWYAHQLPDWFHWIACLLVLLVELVVPWLIVGPRQWRHAACWVLMGFQGVIAATGNYCFFNVLTVSLCVLLLDDLAWPYWCRERLVAPDDRTPAVSRQPAWPVSLVTVVVLLASMAPMASLAQKRSSWMKPFTIVYQWTAPFRLANPYGLFAVMTTTRREIIVEGSTDGITWRAYEFKAKPGEPTQRPGFVAPHQPRLDWQMWFAALGSYEEHPWFLKFVRQLLRGSPDVTALLAYNPFADQPPRYVRAVAYRYQFTDAETRRRTGAWWRIANRRRYSPPLSLRPDDEGR